MKECPVQTPPACTLSRMCAEARRLASPLKQAINSIDNVMMASIHKRDELVVSYLALRKAVGWIALAFPFALGAVHRGSALTSISQSYYRDVGALFVGFLCAIGVFLLFYRGYDGRDRAASFVAGVCAIIVSQVPCGVECRAPTAEIKGLWQWQDDYARILTALHFGTAALMFSALAYFCLVLFPETNKPGMEGRQKLRRNRVYRVCGSIILAMMAVKAVDAVWAHFTPSHLLWDVGTYCVESAMILAFGVSWAVKGESFSVLNDVDTAQTNSDFARIEGDAERPFRHGTTDE